MAFSLVGCSVCSKKYLKDTRHINENLKLNQNFYCSPQCFSKAKNKSVKLGCSNPECKSTFLRTINKISVNNFCSRSCAAKINNVKFPKRVPYTRICKYCGEQRLNYGTYCSSRCRDKANTLTSNYILKLIRKFYREYGRVPVKREFSHYHAARSRFGTWSNAIIAAGFIPNPILFATHYKAKDGHFCDSLSEKIIDDWLYKRKILHRRHVPYLNTRFTADFLVKDKYIEFFGLAGELRRYDQLMEEKLSLIQSNHLNLIAIYPKDLFPKGRLDEILGHLVP